MIRKRKKLRALPILCACCLSLELIPGVMAVETDRGWDGTTCKQPQKDEQGWYLIGTPEELMWWNQNGTKKDLVKLTDDIWLNQENTDNEWPVMCGGREENAFQGTLDGQGHVIYGLSIHQENSLELELAQSGTVYQYSDRISEIGLFGYTQGATICNLGVEGDIWIMDRPPEKMGDWLSVGGLAGFAQGETQIDSCYTNISIHAAVSEEYGTVGGHPKAGYGETCDMFIGGLVGTMAASVYSGSPVIQNSYSMGTLIGAKAQTINIGGIVGAFRPVQNWDGTVHAYPTVQNCYSTASIQAVGKDSAAYPSYLGGIVGDPDFNNKSGGKLEGCYALNRNIMGSNPRLTHAGQVTGKNIGMLNQNCALQELPITGARKDGASGTEISAQQAVQQTEYAGWDTGKWTWNGGYPQLTWQSGPVSEEKEIEYVPQSYPSDVEWDGSFSDTALPPYLNVWYVLKNHDKRLVRHFERSELEQMAREHKADRGNNDIYISSVGDLNECIGWSVSEYIVLEKLLKEADVVYEEGDSLLLPSRQPQALAFSYHLLMSPRYFYPDWQSGSSEGPIRLPTILGLRLGQDTGAGIIPSRNYAYCLMYGQTAPEEPTTGSFQQHITDLTISYPAEAVANATVRRNLMETVEQTRLSSESGNGEVNSAIDEAERLLRSGVATNEELTAAAEKLDAAAMKLHGRRQNTHT